MKSSVLPGLVFFCLLSCSSAEVTDEKSVKRVVTITEYLILNEDFSKLDTVHRQMEIKKYDISNNVLEERSYWGAALTLGGGVSYQYDGQNRKTAEFLLDGHGEIYVKYIIEYSKNTSIKYELLEDNTKEKRQSAEYDTHHNMISEIHYYSNDRVMNDFHYKYDANGNLLERNGTMDSKPIQTNYKAYDSLGNFFEQKSIDPNGTVLHTEKFIYDKFDKDGNWEIRRSISNGIPHSVAFQQIEIR